MKEKNKTKKYFVCKHCGKKLGFMDYPICPYCNGINLE